MDEFQLNLFHMRMQRLREMQQLESEESSVLSSVQSSEESSDQESIFLPEDTINLPDSSSESLEISTFTMERRETSSLPTLLRNSSQLSNAFLIAFKQHLDSIQCSILDPNGDIIIDHGTIELLSSHPSSYLSFLTSNSNITVHIMDTPVSCGYNYDVSTDSPDIECTSDHISDISESENTQIQDLNSDSEHSYPSLSPHTTLHTPYSLYHIQHPRQESLHQRLFGTSNITLDTSNKMEEAIYDILLFQKYQEMLELEGVVEDLMKVEILGR